MSSFSAHLCLDTLVLNDRGIENRQLKNLPFGSEVKTVLLRENLIESFAGMPSSATLENLDLSGNPLLNLRGFPHFPHLISISVWNTPFGKCSSHRLALLLVCPSLRKINGIGVSPQEKRHAEAFPSDCINLVRAGWTGASTIPSEAQLRIIRRQLTDQWSPARKHSLKPIPLEWDDGERRDFVFLRTQPIQMPEPEPQSPIAAPVEVQSPSSHSPAASQSMMQSGVSARTMSSQSPTRDSPPLSPSRRSPK
jgi:hypothetical protein